MEDIYCNTYLAEVDDEVPGHAEVVPRLVAVPVVRLREGVAVHGALQGRVAATASRHVAHPRLARRNHVGQTQPKPLLTLRRGTHAVERLGVTLRHHCKRGVDTQEGAVSERVLAARESHSLPMYECRYTR